MTDRRLQWWELFKDFDIVKLLHEMDQEDAMREFDTGATRDTDEGKPDYEGFLSPLVMARFARYMNKNRVQADGQTRDSDNWQKGIPLTAYMKSAWRHFMEWWTLHRRAEAGEVVVCDDTTEALCALLFNAMGYLHVIEKGRPGEYIPVADFSITIPASSGIPPLKGADRHPVPKDTGGRH